MTDVRSLISSKIKTKHIPGSSKIKLILLFSQANIILRRNNKMSRTIIIHGGGKPIDSFRPIKIVKFIHILYERDTIY